MSAFICDDCDNLRDADDGCEESPCGLRLICAQCADDRQAQRDEDDDRRRDNPLEPDFRRLGQ